MTVRNWREPEEKEAEILREFLPEQLGEAEISKIEEVIAWYGRCLNCEKWGRYWRVVKAGYNAADGALVQKNC